ncbi:energy transducer TonB [Ostreiculturibacter nitratireducens]|uniref:energy transducer TonB n=1 Tax=Ostreiculturibacter nitratireducens TaxID=3075226 RepID=UPI0031B58E83
MILRRVAEPLAFLSLATAVHAAVWIGLPGNGAGGASAEGGGGASAVTLAGSPALSRLAAEWSRPPEAAPEAPRAPAAPETALAPALPALEAETAAAHMVSAPTSLSSLDDDAAPGVDTTPPPPPRVEAAAAPPDATRPKARPDEKPSKPQPATEAAAGKGSAPQAGSAGAVASAPGTAQTGEGALSEGERNSLMAQWAGQIRSRVERRKAYPRAAQVQGLTGTVTLRLTVAPDGRIVSYGIAQSSGHALLDEAALVAVARAGRFPAAPEGLGGQAQSFTLPVTFSR